MSAVKSRHVCFTYNNPTSTPSEFKTLLEAVPKIRYSIFQLESGENGTPHYQGYVEYDSSQRYSYFHTKVVKCHVEKRRGTRAQAREYCRKEDTRIDGPWESGEWSQGGAGTRNDLQAIVESAKSGSLSKVAEQYPLGVLRYPKGIKPQCL